MPDTLTAAPGVSVEGVPWGSGTVRSEAEALGPPSICADLGGAIVTAGELSFMLLSVASWGRGSILEGGLSPRAASGTRAAVV